MASGYQYAHDHKDAYTVPQSYLPDPLEQKKFYHPTSRGYEQQIRHRMAQWQTNSSGSKKTGVADGMRIGQMGIGLLRHGTCCFFQKAPGGAYIRLIFIQ
jgi:hypothetical protein